ILTEDEVKAFRSDKLVALDRNKAEFCYQLCRASNARRIVEAGTSYGVSTLYLAAAVRDNVRATGGDGVVIGTEYEPTKAAAARAHFDEAGLSRFIDLREGDLRETLKQIEGPVDFMLVDIWIAMARPALDLVAPPLRPGRRGVAPGHSRSSSSEEMRHMVTDGPIISADSHITEPPDTYTARIDARFRDRAPRLVHDPKRGDLFVIDGLDKPIPMGLIA